VSEQDLPPSDSLQLRDAQRAAQPRSIEEILSCLPTDPGVYLMKDRRGKIIYIGKAANLRNRVRQYFQPNTGDIRDFVPLLEGIVGDIETVITSNEKEALLLENTLIKRHQPRFNVKLTDDKSFLVLRLDPKAEWPRLEVGRKIRDDGAYYFGPYHSASSCREALRVVNRHFQLRTCTDHVLHNRRRPCLQYQIKRCPAPCVLPVPETEYGEQVRDVRLFLEGKSDELMDRLRLRMKEAAVNMEYERAATVRDQIRALESTLESQRVVSTDFVDQDVIGFHRDGLALELVVLSVRQGKMVGTRSFSFAGQEFPDSEILSSFIGLYYDLSAAPPDELLLPFPIADADLKAEWLSEKRETGLRGRPRKVEVLVPQRGSRRDLIELARKNAEACFTSRRNAREDAEATLARLQRRLRLPNLPRVIECYDISHVQGAETVASMVVFVDGKPEKARYRTYKIQRNEGNDDFASMYEVLSRRFRRAKEVMGDPAAGEASVDDQSPWRLPDLIVVDGGKGQLGMAMAAARDVGIDTRAGIGLPIVALAKEREIAAEPTAEATDANAPPPPARRGRARSVEPDAKRPDRIFLPHAKDPIPIRPNSAEMFVLQHLRDEAHRFAVAFHRGQRKRRTLKSALADVTGIGATRQKTLLRHFGSLKKVRDASVDELSAAPGMTRKAAEAVHAFFAAQPERTPTPVATTPADAHPESDVHSLQADESASSAEEDALESAFAEVEADVDAEREADAGD
jgi:excinuclease ABC subunit C